MSFKFIDLFSGIGGFHSAISQIGGECIFASEIDKYAIETYFENYNINSDINIRDVDPNTIDEFQVLCAGFPCQTFSKAGKREGFNDETKGTLFFEIERILNIKHPRYIILENVRNLVTHDNGNTFKVIKEHLKRSGYRLTENPLIVSPHQLGIPQLRERIIILGIYDPQKVDKPLEISLDEVVEKDKLSIYTILDNNDNNPSTRITTEEETILDAWDEFYKNINIKTIGFPVWIDYFNKSIDENYPKWKKDFIRKNNNLYQENKKFIDMWIIKHNTKDWSPTQRKFEWQCGNKINSLWEGVIQIRPSGIRVKVPTCFPALVAMVQIPIIGKYKRRLSVREAARLQSFPDSFIPNKNTQQAYKQFGNAVNVDVIKHCAKLLFELGKQEGYEDLLQNQN